MMTFSHSYTFWHPDEVMLLSSRKGQVSEKQQQSLDTLFVFYSKPLPKTRQRRD
jgi:hypothetical protein